MNNFRLPQLDKATRNKYNYHLRAFNGGREYVEGYDDRSREIISRFTCEEPSDYNERVCRTPYRAVVPTIINGFLSGVFRQSPSRPDSFSDFVTNSDGRNKSLNSVMKSFGESLLLYSVAFLKVNINDSVSSLAQAAKAPFTVQNLPLSSVLYYRFEEERLVEIVVLYSDSTFSWWKEEENQIILIEGEHGKDYTIKSSESFVVPYIPVIASSTNSAIIESVLESVRSLHNYLSLLNQEIFEKTFSRDIISGARAPENKDDAKISWGSTRMLFIEDAGVSVQTVGSDKSQADSIRTSIEEEIKNIVRVTGQYLDGEGASGVQSGIAIKLQREAYTLICESLAFALNVAENELFQLLSLATGKATDLVTYSSDFIMQNYVEEVQLLRDILSLPLSDEIKQKAVERFQQIFFR
jgi:hypothetical protein